MRPTRLGQVAVDDPEHSSVKHEGLKHAGLRQAEPTDGDFRYHVAAHRVGGDDPVQGGAEPASMFGIQRMSAPLKRMLGRAEFGFELFALIWQVGVRPMRVTHLGSRRRHLAVDATVTVHTTPSAVRRLNGFL
jgi:hypothetical protein